MIAPGRLVRVVAVSSGLALLLGACQQPGPPPSEPTAPPASSAVPSASPSPTPSPAPGAPQPPPPQPPPPQPPPPQDRPALQEIGSFEEPVFVTSPPQDERLFVVERGGRILVRQDGKAISDPFLDISDQVSSGGERGLFSVAFSPDYATSGLAYVHFTDTRGDSRVVEYEVSASDANRLDPASARQILFQDQPYPNHNGGLVIFDPSGMLIIGLGDGGSAGDPQNRAQNLSTSLGKLLRIDPRHPSGGRPYGIPADNPFIGRAGALPEIWAYGLRNPWRFSFDRATGDLYVGDVGQNRFEEIDFVVPATQPGANYGWRAYEGNARFSDEQIDESRLVRPILTYRLEGGACAVTGGNVYRGEVGSLGGFYLYADFCQGAVKGFRVQGSRAVDQKSFSSLRVPHIASFGEDSFGQTYVISLAGKVYRIVRQR